MDQVKVKCICGASLNAPMAAIGKTAKCPRCGGKCVVPDPRQQSAAPIALPPPLPAATTAVHATAPTDVAPPLPQMGGPHNSAATDIHDADTAVEQAWLADAMKPIDSKVLLVGAVIAAVATVTTVLLWVADAAKLDMRLLGVMPLVGLAPALSMVLYVRRHHATCGLVAAGLCIAGIILGQVLIYQWVILPRAAQAALPPLLGAQMAMIDAANAQAQLANQRMANLNQEMAEDPDMRAAHQDLQKMQQQARQSMDFARSQMQMATQRRAQEYREAASSFSYNMVGCDSICLAVLSIALAFAIPTVGK